MCLLFVYPNLVSTMRDNGLGYKDVAEILGISQHAAYRRMRGFTGWKLHETIRLSHFFGISDTAWLFELCDTVTQKL